jgi:hypothetical protein
MIGVTLKLSSVGIFTQCWFRQCAKGGLLATESSHVYVDSSRFIGCNAAFDNDTKGVVTGCAFEGRSEGKDTIACGIVCAMNSSCSVYDNTILSACVDVRENATAELRRDKFVAGELIVWGSSQCNSGQDSFTGEVPTAIRVFNEAHLVASDLKMEKVHKYGIVAENSCDVNMTDVQLASPGNTGVMALEDATVRVASGTIVAAGAFGVVVQAAKRVELSNLSISECGTSGIQVANSTTSLEGLTVQRNRNCGLVLIHTKAAIKNTTFQDNRWSGVHLQNSTANVSESTFARNERGGAFLSSTSELSLKASSFVDNGWMAAYAGSGSTLTATDSTFERNETGVGAAGRARIVNSTFVKNGSIALQVSGDQAGAEVENSAFRQENQAVAAADKAALTLVACSFAGNVLHGAAAGGGTMTDTGSRFSRSTGNYGFHIVEGTANFRKSSIVRSRAIAIFSQGETNMEESAVRDSGQFAVVFSGKASGVIRQSTFERNGIAAFHVVEGTPTIRNNIISGHFKYGVFIADQAHPIVEGNKFEGKVNGLANVWRE